MTNFQKILTLVDSENGKIFLMDEKGEIRAVVMSMEEYDKLKGDTRLDELSERLQTIAHQAEELNREITEAQIEAEDEEIEPALDVGTVAETAAKPDADTEKETFYIEPIEE